MNTPRIPEDSREPTTPAASASSDLLDAVKRLIAANEALGEISANRVTYYEESPTKDEGCYKRWMELHAALWQARKAANNA